ncbi:MAG: Crp/Fnr family transcriptional regulator, partial [Cyclobacteriaceae bacterium]|nr:Crp/Fnr family transcriptional regulator [Cyclobacteriaceae bacterium]
MREIIEKHFPFFKEPELIDAIANVGKEIVVKEGEPIIKIGEFIKSTPLITDGLLKVIRQDDSGHEILLYYLEGGDT